MQKNGAGAQKKRKKIWYFKKCVYLCNPNAKQ